MKEDFGEEELNRPEILYAHRWWLEDNAGEPFNEQKLAKRWIAINRAANKLPIYDEANTAAYRNLASFIYQTPPIPLNVFTNEHKRTIGWSAKPRGPLEITGPKLVEPTYISGEHDGLDDRILQFSSELQLEVTRNEINWAGLDQELLYGLTAINACLYQHSIERRITSMSHHPLHEEPLYSEFVRHLGILTALDSLLYRSHTGDYQTMSFLAVMDIMAPLETNISFDEEEEIHLGQGYSAIFDTIVNARVCHYMPEEVLKEFLSYSPGEIVGFMYGDPEEDFEH